MGVYYFHIFLIYIYSLNLIDAGRNTSVFNYDFYQTEYHVIPRRMEVIRYNKRLAEKVEIRTFKYNRTCTAFNMTVRLLVDKSEELEMIVDVSKFLSNEYRFFPIHFEVNWCKAFEVNFAGFRNGLTCGNFVGCPFEKVLDLENKTYHVCNWIPDEKKYPPGIPTGQYKIRNHVVYGTEEVVVFDGYIDIVNSLFIF